ncbi:MAG: prolipoprotein diacylglyceryl transferase family protein, partial [Bradymonadaceae bacterium]
MQTLAALPWFKLGPWTIPGIGLPVHAFGMMVATGLLVCLAMATWRGETKLGMDGEKVQNFGLWLILVGWIFAHVFNVVFYSPHRVLENPLILL